MDRRKKILLFSRAIEAEFGSSEWTEFGYLSGAEEWINSHYRLLRSLRFGDPDYKEHVLDTVAHILDKAPENARHFIEYPPLNAWLKKFEPHALEQLAAEVNGTEVSEVLPPTASAAALAALADAQTLLQTRGPSSAVDRVHTGLHGFLRATCDQAKLSYPPDPTPNQLLKALTDNHPRLANLGPRAEDIKRILRTSASIVDAMGTLRNRASLAHPNEEILDNDEALLVINIGRSLLRFLDSKLGPEQLDGPPLQEGPDLSSAYDDDDIAF